MDEQRGCPCIGPSCGRVHRGDDACHCVEIDEPAYLAATVAEHRAGEHRGDPLPVSCPLCADPP